MFLHCLASVVINSRGKYRKVLHGLVLGHTKSPILTPPLPVTSVTPVSAKDHTSYCLTSNSLKPVTVPAWKKMVKHPTSPLVACVNYHNGSEGVQTISFVLHSICVCFCPKRDVTVWLVGSILYFMDKVIQSFKPSAILQCVFLSQVTTVVCPSKVVVTMVFCHTQLCVL